MIQSKKIAFLGGSDQIKPFIVLSNIIDCIPINNWNVLVIVDSEKGRFFNFLIEYGIDYEIVRESLSIEKLLNNFKPDYLVTCGWNKILSNEVLQIPSKASINCHSSCLPDYKGASVFKHYWSNCEEYSGASIHYLNEKIDCGNLICSGKFKIFKTDTPKKILWRTSELTAVLLLNALNLVENNYRGVPQKGGRYFYRISNTKHVVYWAYNIIATFLKFPKKLTPHRAVE